MSRYDGSDVIEGTGVHCNLHAFSSTCRDKATLFEMKEV
jgi:hypothetical protein